MAVRIAFSAPSVARTWPVRPFAVESLRVANLFYGRFSVQSVLQLIHSNIFRWLCRVLAAVVRLAVRGNKFFVVFKVPTLRQVLVGCRSARASVHIDHDGLAAQLAKPWHGRSGLDVLREFVPLHRVEHARLSPDFVLSGVHGAGGNLNSAFQLPKLIHYLAMGSAERLLR